MTIRSIQTTAASAAVTLAWVPPNPAVDDGPFNVQVVINKTGAGVFKGTVQYTVENVMESGVSAFAVTEQASVAGATGVNITHPAYAVRLAIVSASGNNQIAFRVLQTGA